MAKVTENMWPNDENTRPVVMKVTIQYVEHFPWKWDRELIEDIRNDTGCASNTFRLLYERFWEQADEGGTCLCPFAEFSYIREATPEDVKTFRAEEVEEV